MMSKRAQTTMTGVIIAIVVTMGLFYGMFEYTQSNYDSSGITEDAGYNESYSSLNTSQQNLNDDVEDVKNSVEGIVEADANIALIAWNGLTGLAATIRLFIGLIDVSITVFDSILPALRFFPIWVKTLMSLAIISLITLLVLGAFKGESKT